MPGIVNIDVKEATYVDGYRLSVFFTNGKNTIVDFSGFIANNNKEILAKYKSHANFKKFRIEEGNIVWGKNWDLIFPVEQLYKGKIKD